MNAMTTIPATSSDATMASAVVVCLVCRLAGRAGSGAEAAFLAAIHDGLHHAARPTATPAPLAGDGAALGGAA